MTTPAPLLAVAALACSSVFAPHADAAFMVIDTFESGNSFGGSTTTDPTNPGNTVLQGPINDQNRNRLLSASTQLNDNAVGTFFFQAIITSHNDDDGGPNGHDTSVGLTANGGTNFGDFITQVGFVSTNATTTELRIRNGNGIGGGTFNSVGTLTLNTTYNIWTVADLNTNSYDVYVEGAGFAGQQLVADNFGFRQTANPGPLTNILIRESAGPALNSPLLTDNYYSDQAGANLANPVPEPSAVAFALVGLAGALLRRSRRS